MPTFNASNAQVLIYTYKEGLLSAIAHDLKLSVGKFEVSVEGASLQATFDAKSLTVVNAMKDGADAAGTLSDKDKGEIEANIVKDVLDAGKHPTIQFASSSIAASGGSWKVEGNLTIKSNTKPVSFHAERKGDQLVAELTIHQPDFGVKPYSAMLGTLKIKPEIKLVLMLPASAAG
jgi:polyisoprenoid-binding protein YceI